MFSPHRLLMALLLACGLAGPALIPTTQAQSEPELSTAIDSRAAIIFIENAGQFAEGARFLAQGRDASLWLAEDAIWLTTFSRTVDTAAGLSVGKGANIKIGFSGANPHPHLEPFNRLETHVSFFTGSNPAKWRSDVPAWGGVRYVDLYPGIDLELAGAHGRLEPRLIARPNADLASVRLQVEGVEAVEAKGGTLRLITSTGAAIYNWPLPRVEGAPTQASVRPVGASSFEVIAPFAGVESDLDPTIVGADLTTPSDLLYSSFLGGGVDDVGFGVAVDAGGAAYVTGYTLSGDFPTAPGAFDTTHNGNADVFVVKLNPSGSGLDYATFVGGSAGDWGLDIAVDESGAAYVTGQTGSTDLPTTPGAFDSSFNSNYWYDWDGFVMKLNPAGSALAYATYLGGIADERATAIAVDGSGAAYVVGWTGSSDFPTTPGAFDPTRNGGGDAFVAKLNESGSALDYSTFLGGNDMDAALSIAVDESGAAYVTGWTGSSDFPTTPGVLDTTRNGGLYEGFVAKLNPSGSALAYATYLGGSSDEWSHDIAVDANGAVYVTGATDSSDFPTTPGAFDTSFNGGSIWGDAFVVKLNSIGSALVYGTFLGGPGQDRAESIDVDESGVVYIVGWTAGFPTTCGAFDTTTNGNYDLFVARLNKAGSGLDYSTYLGGSGFDGGYGDYDRRSNGIAVDGSAGVYVTGLTGSSDFPTTPGAFDTSYNGGDQDAFVAKLRVGGPPYSICGRVTDFRGQGVPHVSVSAGPGAQP